VLYRTLHILIEVFLQNLHSLVRIHYLWISISILTIGNRGSLFMEQLMHLHTCCLPIEDVDFISFDDANAMNKMLQEVVCLVLFANFMILFHSYLKNLLKLTRFYIDSY